MYQKVSDPEFVHKHREARGKAVFVMKDEHGGVAACFIDDGCFVLYLEDSDSGELKPTAWWFKEAAQALSDYLDATQRNDTPQV